MTMKRTELAKKKMIKVIYIIFLLNLSFNTKNTV